MNEQEELKAAVERVRKCQAEGPDAAYPQPKAGAFHEDCLTIADAYLAEHPADNDEAVTEEWLQSVGFKSPRDNAHCPFIFSRFGADKFCLAFDPSTMEMTLEVGTRSAESFCIPDAPTRGHVRRLCQVLGITLSH